MIDRRSKMVSFRLSWEEYKALQQACSTAGVRSLSELARAAMQHLINGHHDGVPLHDQLRESARPGYAALSRGGAHVPEDGSAGRIPGARRPDWRSHMNKLCSAILAAAFCAAVLAQHEPARPPVATSFTDGSNLPQEKIGRDDLVGIYVYDSPELTRTVRVSVDGAIRLPMLKERIPAAGLYPVDLEAAIAAALTKEQVLVNPIVTVSVVEYRSRPISVVGAVKTPLTFQATGIVTLLDAISRAGGLAENAGPEILVSRPQVDPDGHATTLVQRIPVRGLVNAADPALNVRLEGGEELRVPEAGRIFVVGDVKQPGAFLIQDGAESSVLKALALSQGLLPYASKTAYIYRTEGGAGGKNEIPIELRKIIDRKSPDVPLLANDIVYIPDNSGRRNTMSALDKVLLISAGLGAAVIYTLR